MKLIFDKKFSGSRRGRKGIAEFRKGICVNLRGTLRNLRSKAGDDLRSTS